MAFPFAFIIYSAGARRNWPWKPDILVNFRALFLLLSSLLFSQAFFFSNQTLCLFNHFRRNNTFISFF